MAKNKIKKERPRGGLINYQRDIWKDQMDALKVIEQQTGLSIAALGREALDLLISKYNKS
jgi:hypothetical protein